MNNGAFLVSLDFELMWGLLDCVTLEKYGKNVIAVHTVLPQILHLFEKYEIHATIAHVGFLGFKNKDELLKALPVCTPLYDNPKLSPYRNHFSYLNDANEKYFFAPELLELIHSTPNVELGTHTYSHYYCTEQGQNLQSFEQDIKFATEQINGMSSIIFPRNQVSEEYLHILPEYGINTYRGNPSKLFNKKDGGRQRLLRFIDTYLNITGYQTYKKESLSKSIPFNIPASRFLRSYNTKLAMFEYFKLKRIKDEMTYAAKHGEMYHIWWHPHNFGDHTFENLNFLEKILKHYQFLSKEYDYRSMTMNEYYNRMLKIDEIK